MYACQDTDTHEGQTHTLQRPVVVVEALVAVQSQPGVISFHFTSALSQPQCNVRVRKTALSVWVATLLFTFPCFVD